MAGFRAAKRYAKGLMQFAVEINQAQQINQEMVDLKNALTDNRELVQFLNSPVLDAKRKNVIAKEIFKDFSQPTQNFIQLVINQGRGSGMKEIAVEYNDLYNKLNNIRIAEVVSAVKLDDAMVQEIVDQAKQTMGAEYSYEIENRVDPNLIGGFILRVGDKQVDSSVRSKLTRLKKQFDKNEYIPKI
ncbi:ATP synthase F1 subunit delta [Moheibacter sediminis]|uniref:ATP synthase subunit delta n=1 Tax=Moheibacter sediminis TaxID=1434700 RepID=A0A1W2BFD8_9FLAO|nr:ATP synthase F1 subunit delta [Moheibacter sediminis]SMC71108.1 F-type H+-transporting ATPase subunit delta [Moheibacter sediminis]